MKVLLNKKGREELFHNDTFLVKKELDWFWNLDIIEVSEKHLYRYIEPHIQSDLYRGQNKKKEKKKRQTGRHLSASLKERKLFAAFARTRPSQ